MTIGPFAIGPFERGTLGQDEERTQFILKMVISFVCLVPVHPFLSSMAVLYHVNKEREQERQRRLRKRHLKSEVALLQTLSRLFHLVQFVKCWKFF